MRRASEAGVVFPILHVRINFRMHLHNMRARTEQELASMPATADAGADLQTRPAPDWPLEYA